eukprot:gene45087-54420_t
MPHEEWFAVVEMVTYCWYVHQRRYGRADAERLRLRHEWVIDRCSDAAALRADARKAERAAA